jgi:hypothetical protein
MNTGEGRTGVEQKAPIYRVTAPVQVPDGETVGLEVSVLTTVIRRVISDGFLEHSYDRKADGSV